MGAHAEPRRLPLTPEAFGAETGVSRETLDRLRRYAALLERWNRSVNLVAAASLTDLWRRHFLDSAQLMPLLPAVPVNRDRTLVDLGSGAGFPGLVLAILGAGQTHLVESDRRKIAFLREAARETGTPVVLHADRIEALAPFAADAVTARALAPLPQLLAWAAPFLTRAGPGARGLFPKGRRVQEELTKLDETWKMRIESVPSRTEHGAKIIVTELL